jgi:hypothetical protein
MLAMQRNTLAIATLICGLMMLFGCGTPATRATANETKPITQEATTRDAAVLQVVFDDMLSKENRESPTEWRDKSKPLYVSKHTSKGRMDAAQLLSPSDERSGKPSRRLSRAQRPKPRMTWSPALKTGIHFQT